MIRPPRAAAAAIYATALAAGCSGRAPPGADPTAAASPAAEERILNVYSWTDYIAPNTIAEFEKQTGIKVHYDTFVSDEVLETKLLTGHSNYDIVVPTGPYFEHEAKAGVFRKLNRSELPLFGNLDPGIMARLAVHDPGNEHAVPYMWSTTGIGYNVDQVRARFPAAAPTHSWALVFDPKNAAKLADCGISVLDAAPDIVGSALIYLGRDPNTEDPADFAAAEKALMRVRPFIRYIDSSQYISDLANGSVCVSVGWSGDIVQARSRAAEAGKDVHIAYVLPREGGWITVDMMSIPADARHPRNAHLWMTYLMRPQVAADQTNAINYPNGNLAALAYVKDSIKNDPAIYPSAQILARLHPHRAESPEKSRAYTRLWTRFRTGN